MIDDDEGGLGWGRTDPEIHVTVELVQQLNGDDIGRAFLTSMYKLGEPCPHRPGHVHARRRAQLPTLTGEDHPQ